MVLLVLLTGCVVLSCVVGRVDCYQFVVVGWLVCFLGWLVRLMLMTMMTMIMMDVDDIDSVMRPHAQATASNSVAANAANQHPQPPSSVYDGEPRHGDQPKQLGCFS